MEKCYKWRLTGNWRPGFISRAFTGQPSWKINWGSDREELSATMNIPARRKEVRIKTYHSPTTFTGYGTTFTGYLLEECCSNGCSSLEKLVPLTNTCLVSSNNTLSLRRFAQSLSVFALNEAVASWAVFVIVSGTGGRKRFWSQLNNSKTACVSMGG